MESQDPVGWKQVRLEQIPQGRVLSCFESPQGWKFRYLPGPLFHCLTTLIMKTFFLISCQISLFAVASHALTAHFWEESGSVFSDQAVVGSSEMSPEASLLQTEQTHISQLLLNTSRASAPCPLWYLWAGLAPVSFSYWNFLVLVLHKTVHRVSVVVSAVPRERRRIISLEMLAVPQDAFGFLCFRTLLLVHVQLLVSPGPLLPSFFSVGQPTACAAAQSCAVPGTARWFCFCWISWSSPACLGSSEWTCPPPPSYWLLPQADVQIVNKGVEQY